MDSNFRKLIFTSFFMAVSMKTFALLIFPFQTYLLLFTSAEFYLYVLISFFGKFAWYFIWKKLLKRGYILRSYLFSILSASTAGFLGIFFLGGILSYELKLLLYIITFSTILGQSYAFPLFSIPVSAALVHEAAVKIDENNVDKSMAKISGSYYGLASFTRSIGPAFASIFVGIILSGSNEANPTIITLIFSSIGIFYLIAFMILRKLKINHLSFYNR